MAVRRIKLHCVSKLLCLAVPSLIVATYFLGKRTQSPQHETQQHKAGHHLKFYNMSFHATPNVTRKFELRSKPPRNNLIIVSHGRSGSSLMGDIFNHHPSVFYMYEPLQAPQRVAGTSYRNVRYVRLVEQYLSGLFHCKFNHPQILADIESYYRKPDHPRISQAIASPPLCPYETTDKRWNPKHCYPMTSESLESVCKNNYNLTAIKVLISRIPENSIKTILSTCKPPDVDCKIVFLVRDPRAVISSSRKIGFFREGGTRDYSYTRCKQTEDNLEYIRKLPDSLRDRIKLQRYEDLAMNPLKELSGLYEFAGLPVLESVRTWLNKTTRLSRKDCNKMDGVDVTCTKDVAWAAVNRWRWNTSSHEIDIIEHTCEGVMRLMGYRPVNRSKELQKNVKIPLFSDNFEAKHWFLH